MTASERELWVEAAALVEAHGPQALEIAVARGVELYEAGDIDGLKRWAGLHQRLRLLTATCRGSLH